jgi:RNA polymerase sigma factor for flagellar operon FliA
MNTTTARETSKPSIATRFTKTASPSKPRKGAQRADPSQDCNCTNTMAERDRLVTEHLHLVETAAGRMKKSYGHSFDYDELVSFGNKGLLDAARRYDPATGTPFTVFAFYRIRGAMLDGLRSTGSYSRYDTARFNTVEKLRADQRVNELLEEKLRSEGASPEETAGVAATLESIAETLAQISTVQVFSLEAARSRVIQAKRAGFDSSGCSGDVSGDLEREPTAPGADALFEAATERHAVRQRLERALATLPAAERRLIELHYFADQDFKDIRAPLGMSKWNVSRLHSRAIRMLRLALSETPETVDEL